MPLVSVITPAYNVERWIREAVSSALGQSIGDLEVLVVDDGSRDRTAALVEELAASDPRVRLLRTRNRGVSAARNAALAVASGEFLALLDGDDVWDARFLEEQLAVFRTRPEADVVIGNARELGGPRDGQPSRPSPDPRAEPGLAAIIADETAVFIMSVFKRRVYERIGGFDESLRTNEDYEYWLRAAAAGFRFVRNHHPLGQYRRSGASLSANEVRMMRGILRVFQQVRPSLLERPRELALLDGQVERFGIELLAAEARAAIEGGDPRRAAACLGALYKRRPALDIALARALAWFAPALLGKMYRARRSRLAATRGRTNVAA